jgi:hypothetical protein
MLRKYFKSTKDKMFADFTLTKGINHNLTKGEIREDSLVIEFLKKYLPKKYSFSPGIIIDSDGVQSSQQDLIIYDDFNSPLLPEIGKNKIFYPEIVQIIIEVKSSLNSEEIEDSYKKALSVINLKRNYFKFPDRGEMPPNVEYLLQPFFICICYESGISLETAALKMRDLSNNNNGENAINLICILNGLKNETGLIANVDPMNIMNILSYPKKGSKLAEIPYTNPEDSLLFTYLIIMNNLKIKETTLLFPDINIYAKASGFPPPVLLFSKEEQKGAYVIDSQGKRIDKSIGEINELSMKVIKNEATDEEIIDWFYNFPKIPGCSESIDDKANFLINKEIAFPVKPIIVFRIIEKMKSDLSITEEELKSLNGFIQFMKETTKGKKQLEIGYYK